MKKIIVVLSAIALLSCSTNNVENENLFFSISGLNAELTAELDFDLLSIKMKADAVYATDDNFYLDLLDDMAGGPDNKCFERAGISLDLISAKGEYLNRSGAKDSLARLMMLSFANNIELANCTKSSTDSLCQSKLKWQQIMQEYDPRKAQVGYTFFLSDFRSLHDKNYLSEDEFHYMILYFHYLGVLTATDLDLENYCAL